MDPKRDDMIVKNLPLVSFVVSKMSDENGNRSFDREDAVAYGVEGLIQAVDSFDPSRGTTFASFAIRRIRGSILDAIRRMDVLPRSLRKSAREIEKANLELASQLGRWPSLNELAFRVRRRRASCRSSASWKRDRPMARAHGKPSTRTNSATRRWPPTVVLR